MEYAIKLRTINVGLKQFLRFKPHIIVLQLGELLSQFGVGD
jgi:hypothetical protein